MSFLPCLIEAIVIFVGINLGVMKMYTVKKSAIKIIIVSMIVLPFLTSFKNVEVKSVIDSVSVKEVVVIEVEDVKGDLKVKIFNAESDQGEISFLNKDGVVMKKEEMELNADVSYFTWYNHGLPSDMYKVSLKTDQGYKELSFKI